MQLDTLSITQVETRTQLDQLLDSGLATLYKNVFGGAPYFEEFTLGEVKDIFREFMDKKGIVFVAADAGKPVAFVASVPLRAEFELAKIAEPYNGVDIDKAAYFAEDGVAEEYRRIGLSARMKQMLIDANKAAGLPQMLLRTSAKNYAQINAVNKAGGRVLSSAFQKVARKTKNGQEIDTNAFYLFGAESSDAGNRKLERVVIVRTPSGRDEAFVFGRKGGALWNFLLTDKIKDNFPSLKRVRYVSNLNEVKDGKVIFDGRLYANEGKCMPPAFPPMPC